MKQTTQKRLNYYRLLVSSALITGGLFQLALPVFAAGTAAGTQIKNTATATYEDPSAPGTPINATSNEVTATVAEVAGITATPAGITDSTPATPILPLDVITYDFLITNVGNDATTIAIPSPVLTGPAVVGTVTFDIDADGNGTFETLGTNEAAAEAAILQVGGQIKVHVPVTVDNTATSGAPITVQLGNTPPNDNSAATQNQPDGSADADDVRTVDATNGSLGETNGAPNGGEKEAAAKQQILVGANPQAFAAVLKTNTYSAGALNTAPFADDTITYNLSLRVDNGAPAGASPALTPADLEGTTIQIDGSPQKAVLVSDAVPANTYLESAPPAPPSGWTVVYSTSDPTGGLAPNNVGVAWTTTAPTFPDTTGTIKRVGFVKIDNTGTAGTDESKVTKNTTVTGFSFVVKFVTGSTLETAGGSVYNVGQLFGQSTGTTKLVYDESGDQAPSNFNDNGSQGPTNPDGTPTVSNGVADPNNDGVDSNNNNTGTGTGGEDNVVNIAGPNNIFNGPLNTPFAVGPTDNNDDFTNKSTTVAPGLAPGATIDPAELTFTNTLQAPAATTLTNVLLRPVGINNVTKDGVVGGAVNDLPNGTIVTLSYGANTAVYTYNSATDQFIFTSGNAIQIPTLVGGTPTNYTVKIDLPTLTSLSTDSTATEKGYSVPLLAFSDADNDGILDVGEVNNYTIDRVYTGFLKLVKKSAVLQGTALNAPAGGDATLDTQPKTVVPGNILQYAIEYENISTESVGTGNVILNANNVKVSDTGINTNGWGLNNTNGVITTSHVLSSVINKLGSAGSSQPGLATLTNISATAAYFAGPAATTSVLEQTGTTQATDVTKYEITLPVPAAPGEGPRTFGFQRKVN